MSKIISYRNIKLIEEIEKKDLVYNISDESGEIFINSQDLTDAINESDVDYISFPVDILVSGDPIREGLIDFTNEKEFHEFLLQFK